MSEIDRRIDKLIQKQTTDLGGETLAATLREPARDSYDREGQNQKDPPTTNPSSEELTYRGADAARDVLERLERYVKIDANARLLDLEQVLGLTHRSAREFLNEEEEYILAAIRLLSEQHLWGPRFFNDLSAGIDADAVASDYQTAWNVINTLRGEADRLERLVDDVLHVAAFDRSEPRVLAFSDGGAAGTLRLGTAGVLPDTTRVTIDTLATFDLNDFDETVAFFFVK